MVHRLAAKALLILILGIDPLCASRVQAALGGDTASVFADSADMHGTVRAIPLLQYDIQEITADNGMRLREFLNREGLVFAVTWSGPVVPDLQRLLGGHFTTYSEALAALQQPGLHRSLRIASDGLIVELGGHLRAYTGRAYLPALVPSGIPTADLR
ncbi:MAG: DUF2844 domain-containing protein [Gammaproteobacteria bacterium]